jgi:hypothetical protein
MKQRLSRRQFGLGLLPSAAALRAQAAEWTPLFDGKTLNGWKEAPFYRRGTVTVRDNSIILGKGSMTGIAWTGGFPTTNYEVRFEAARLEGKDFFAGLTFPVADSHCSWINGGWDGTVVGLSNIDGYDAAENELSLNRDFANGQWYRFRLAVTKQRIEGWIDDVRLIEVDLNVHRVSLRLDDIDLCTPLGFASYATVAGLRQIAWRPLT